MDDASEIDDKPKKAAAQEVSPCAFDRYDAASLLVLAAAAAVILLPVLLT